MLLRTFAVLFGIFRVAIIMYVLRVKERTAQQLSMVPQAPCAPSRSRHKCWDASNDHKLKTNGYANTN